MAPPTGLWHRLGVPGSRLHCRSWSAGLGPLPDAVSANTLSSPSHHNACVSAHWVLDILLSSHRCPPAGLCRVTHRLLCCWVLQGGPFPAALLQAILESCRGALDRTVDLLLEKEVLTGEQLTEILNLHPPMPQQRPPPDSEVRLPAKLHPMACAVPSLSMPCV